MAKTLQFRRATTSGLSAVTGAVGEIFIDTTKNTVVVMDGSTAGGHPLQPELTANSDITVDTILAGDLFLSNNIVSILPTYSTDGYNTEIAQPLIVNGDLDVVGQINGSDSVIYVYGKGTPAENATELQAAVDRAKTLTANMTNSSEPYTGLSFTYGFLRERLRELPNFPTLTPKLGTSKIKVEIVVHPGFYDFTSLSTNYLKIDANYVAVVSLTGQADVMVDSGNTHPIQVTGKSVACVGLNSVGSNGGILENDTTSPDNTYINCHGYNFAFTSGKGTYYKCSGLAYAFGSSATASTDASGLFIDCVASYNSFGSSLVGGANTGIASGAFINCSADGGTSFGGGGNNDVASGYFENCSVDNNFSFGRGTASGRFVNCRGKESCFGYNTASGTFEYCVSGRNSFGVTTLSGKLYYCRIRDDGVQTTFNTVSGSGKTIYCIDGFDATNNQ